MLLLEEQRREQQRDQRRDEGQRDRLGERHPADAPEEQERHHRHDDAAADVDPQRRPVGPRLSARQIERRADDEVGDRAPDADGDDADGEDQMLHHRVHDRQHRDRAERGGEGLDGMLGDAVHAPRLAAISRRRREARLDGAESISSGGSDGRQRVGERSAQEQDEQQLGHGAMLRRQGEERLNLFGGVERRRCSRGFDLGRLGFDQPDDMVDHVGVLDMVVGDAGEIDHVLAVAAAGDADVGLARFAGAVDDAAEHR